ncbi:MAG: hypothetical protein ACOVOR_03650 [Rhabdochlamydiaceae bacterium]
MLSGYQGSSIKPSVFADPNFNSHLPSVPSQSGSWEARHLFFISGIILSISLIAWSIITKQNPKVKALCCANFIPNLGLYVLIETHVTESSDIKNLKDRCGYLENELNTTPSLNKNISEIIEAIKTQVESNLRLEKNLSTDLYSVKTLSTLKQLFENSCNQQKFDNVQDLLIKQTSAEIEKKPIETKNLKDAIENIKKDAIQKSSELEGFSEHSRVLETIAIVEKLIQNGLTKEAVEEASQALLKQIKIETEGQGSFSGFMNLTESQTELAASIFTPFSSPRDHSTAVRSIAHQEYDCKEEDDDNHSLEGSVSPGSMLNFDIYEEGSLLIANFNSVPPTPTHHIPSTPSHRLPPTPVNKSPSNSGN